MGHPSHGEGQGSGNVAPFVTSLSVPPWVRKRVGGVVQSGSSDHVFVDDSARGRIVPTKQRVKLPGNPSAAKTNLRFHPL